MSQIARFPDGGFVMHKASVGGKNYSAWFDRSGKIIDAERSGGGYVKPRGPLWEELQERGRPHVPRQNPVRRRRNPPASPGTWWIAAGVLAFFWWKSRGPGNPGM